MMSPQCRPACGRTTIRIGVIASGLAILLVMPARAQDAPAPAQPPPQPAPDAPAQAPAQPQAPAPAQPPSNPFVLGSQAGLFTYVIKADKTYYIPRAGGPAPAAPLEVPPRRIPPPARPPTGPIASAR